LKLKEGEHLSTTKEIKKMKENMLFIQQQLKEFTHKSNDSTGVKEILDKLASSATIVNEKLKPSITKADIPNIGLIPTFHNKAYSTTVLPNVTEKIVQYNQGNSLHNSKKYAEAAECYKLALFYDPNYKEAKIKLAQIYESTGFKTEAEELYKSILKIEGTTRCKETLLNYAGLLMKMQRYAEAKECYTKVLENNSNDAILYYNIGICLFLLRNHAEAIKYLKKAYSMNNTLINSLDFLGKCYYEIQNYNESFKCFKVYFDVNPASYEAKVNLEKAFSKKDKVPFFGF